MGGYRGERKGKMMRGGRALVAGEQGSGALPSEFLQRRGRGLQRGVGGWRVAGCWGRVGESRASPSQLLRRRLAQHAACVCQRGGRVHVEVLGAGLADEIKQPRPVQAALRGEQRRV